MSRSGSFAYRKAKIVPDNLLAFPPSLVVIVRGVSRSGSFAWPIT